MRSILAFVIMLACVVVTWADVTDTLLFERVDVDRGIHGPWAGGDIPIPAQPTATCAVFRITGEVVREYSFKSFGHGRIQTSAASNAIAIFQTGSLDAPLVVDQMDTPAFDTGFMEPGDTVTVFFFHQLDGEMVVTDPATLGDIQAGTFSYVSVVGASGMSISGSGNWQGRVGHSASIRSIAQVYGN